MKFDITVFEGGEDLYVYPFSVELNPNSSQNKIIHTHPEEFYPHRNDYILETNYSHIAQFLKMTNVLSLKRIWYCKIKKFFAALKWSFKTLREFKIDFGSLKDFWFYMSVFHRGSVTLLAASYPNIRVSIDGQLRVQDNDNVSQTYYLTPSRKYLHKRILDWIEEKTAEPDKTEDGYDNYFKQDAIALKEWMKKEEAKGREIQYLASLNT